MTDRTIILSVCLLSAWLGTAAAQADTGMTDPMSIQEVTRANPTVQDLDITEKIKSELGQDTALQPALTDVKLKTVNGVVHLKGNVNSESEKKAIEDRVRAISGVGQVNSHLSITSRLN